MLWLLYFALLGIAAGLMLDAYRRSPRSSFDDGSFLWVVVEAFAAVGVVLVTVVLALYHLFS